MHSLDFLMFPSPATSSASKRMKIMMGIMRYTKEQEADTYST